MIAIVSHDAGGAEILSSWLLRNQQPYCLVLDGPAIVIFQRKLGNCEIHPLAHAIESCDWVLCGTSWQSNLEKQAIAQAKVAGKKVIAFLDHWVNYSERFQLDGITIQPDEIWVGDVDAQKIAQETFPETRVALNPNPYFKDLQIELKSIQKSPSNSNKCSILYVCEPIREHALLSYGNERYWGYTEEDALQFFLENIDSFGTVSEIKICPHPSESNNKYDWARLANSLVTETEMTKTLIEQIVEADVVVGCESMAMVVGLLAK
ncbi:MAG: hypothetical protein HOE45_10465, partial [Gammaproteobacteria bacterium]|nr:hypothetical protein [Gammaproteobacteria bacterium]